MAKVKVLYTNSEVIKEKKRRNKLMRMESIKQLEIETNKKEKMFFLLLDEQKREEKQREIQKKKEVNSISLFLNKYASLLPYREWLTLRDILTHDRVQIKSDINKGKITIEQYKKISDIANQLVIG